MKKKTQQFNQIQIILTPVNAEFPSKPNEELYGRKYTWSPVFNQVAADTDAPLLSGL